MTRSWDAISASCREGAEAVPSLGGMSTLVEAIRGSRHAQVLHAWTSMHQLFIVQRPVAYPYDGPRLSITSRADGLLEFRYLQHAGVAEPWCRVVDGDHALACLERFMQHMGWLPRMHGIVYE